MRQTPDEATGIWNLHDKSQKEPRIKRKDSSLDEFNFQGFEYLQNINTRGRSTVVSALDCQSRYGGSIPLARSQENCVKRRNDAMIALSRIMC